MANIDDIAYAIGADKKNPTGIKDWFGRVVSMSPFKVARLGSEIGVECVNLAAASVGDMVYVLKRPDGQHVSIGTVGGGVTPTTLYTTLYNNSSGTNGTVTLSQSAANFDHIRIAFGYPTDNVHQSITVCNPNGKYTQLCIPETSGSNGWVIGRNVYISGTSIATRGNWYGEGRVNDSYGWNNTNGTSIYKVEGWND